MIRPYYFRQNGPKQPENSFFKLFWVILGPFGHPQMDPKRLPMAGKWAKCMARCLSFNIRPNQIIRLILQGKIVQNNQKKGFCAVFGHFGAPPNGPKKIHKVPQLSGMSRPMTELKNKPLTRSLGLFFFVDK
jgi:hypothetical protein